MGVFILLSTLYVICSLDDFILVASTNDLGEKVYRIQTVKNYLKDRGYDA